MTFEEWWARQLDPGGSGSDCGEPFAMAAWDAAMDRVEEVLGSLDDSMRARGWPPYGRITIQRVRDRLNEPGVEDRG